MKRYIKTTSDIEYDADRELAFDIYRGYKYYVSGGDNDTKYTNDPRTAIKYWFQLSSKYPGDTAIFCKTKAGAVELVMDADADYLTRLWNQYKNPYKLEYLISECEKAFENGCRYFHECEYGDQVHPFSFG